MIFHVILQGPQALCRFAFQPDIHYRLQQPGKPFGFCLEVVGVGDLRAIQINRRVADGRRETMKKGRSVDQLDRRAFTRLEGDVLSDHRNSAGRSLPDTKGLNALSGLRGAVQQAGLAQKTVPFQAALVVVQQIKDLAAGTADGFGDGFSFHNEETTNRGAARLGLIFG
jgi:hypothetical protein